MSHASRALPVIVMLALVAAAGCHAGARDGGPAPPPTERWETDCAPCHQQQVARMKSSQMYTNAGMIGQIQATWEGTRDDAVFGAVAGEQYRPDGAPLTHAPVAALDNLSGDLYRKFCARCHLATADDSPDGGHPAGCAACHTPSTATPPGGTHAVQGLPTMDACATCHHRSGRAALSYQGLNDGNNSLVPTRNGMPGPVPGTDARTFTHTAPDVHFTAGMECIDCHTAREVMGDGYASVDMHGQLEIRCEDCHGDGNRRPALAPVSRESDAPVRESRQYKVPVRPGMRMALTSKGRSYSNVYDTPEGIVLATKRTGTLLRVPIVTGSAAHRIAGHERMECSSCHSRTVAQCYGCHTTYDKRSNDWDLVKNIDTPGAFSETEDYRTLYPFPLALNSRGRISPVTPGCQTFITLIEQDGTHSKDEYVAKYKGKPQLRFSSFFGHTTGSRAVGCTECHANPAFLGFGQHVLERGTIRSTLLCERNDKKPLDGFLSIDRGRVVAHAAITREGARPLDDAEVRRVFDANLCLICHTSVNDPIYLKPLDYRALDDQRHRRLLAAGR